MRRQQQIKDLPDKAIFKLSDRSKVEYRLDRIAKGHAIITSTNSDRTYRVKANKAAYNI